MVGAILLVVSRMRFWIPTFNAMLTILANLSELWRLNEYLWYLRLNVWMGRFFFRLARKDLKNLRKVDRFGKVLSSKLRMNCERPSGFHLFERIVVTAEHWFCLRVIVAAATLKLWNLVMVFCEEPRGLAAVVLWEEGYGFYLLVLEIFCFYISPYRPIWPIFKPIHFCVF
jgi:hypothetical protein